MTLTGPFAQLIRGAIAELVENLDEHDDEDAYETGVQMFDELGRNARLSLVARVASALLRDETPPPAKRAVNDATVAAIFSDITNVVISYDAELEDEWRRLVIASLCQIGSEQVPTLNAHNSDAWLEALVRLRDYILEDSDYLLEQTADRPPDVSRRFKELADIPQDYFAEPAPEPSDEELKQILADLCELAGTIEVDYLPTWMHRQTQLSEPQDRTTEVRQGTWVEQNLGNVVLQGRIVAGTSQLAIFRLERTVPIKRQGRRRKQYKEWQQGEHVSAPWSSLRIMPAPHESLLDKLPDHKFAVADSGQYFAVVDTQAQIAVAIFVRRPEAETWASYAGRDYEVVSIAA